MNQRWAGEPGVSSQGMECDSLKQVEPSVTFTPGWSVDLSYGLLS